MNGRRSLRNLPLLLAAGLTVGVAATLVPGASRAATTSAGSTNPAGVRTASLRQHSPWLVWRVALDHGISAAQIGRRTRSVCLLLQRRSSGETNGRLCLARSVHGGLALAYSPVGGTRIGTPRVIDGSVTLSSGGTIVLSRFTPVQIGRSWSTLRWQTQTTATVAGCPTAGAAAHLCTVLFPASHHPLATLHTPQLVGCVPSGPSLVTGGSDDKREVALTFDDGPWDDPPSIDFVNELHTLDVPATFFEIGDQIHEFDPTGSVERAMLADGDMIGDHTWTHPNMLGLSTVAQTAELQQTNAAIRTATGGFTPCLWRPPYGDTDDQLESLARGLGMLTIYWNDDSRDWALPGTGAIVSTALSEAHDGSIIIMHFGGGPREETLAAIPAIVSGLRARGYTLVNVAQLLGLREIWR